MFSNADVRAIARYMGYSYSTADLSYVNSFLSPLAVDAEVVEEIQGIIRNLRSLESERQDAAPFAGASFLSSPGGSRQYFRGERTYQVERQIKVLKDQLQQMTNIPRRGGGGTSYVEMG
jgi:hypothetical protein